MIECYSFLVVASSYNPYHLSFASQPIKKLHTYFLSIIKQLTSFDGEIKTIKLGNYKIIFLYAQFLSKLTCPNWSLFKMLKVRLSLYNGNKSLCFELVEDT